MIPQTKVSRIKKRVKDSCEYCSGGGCLKCNTRCSRIDKYHASNIPVEYWDKSFKDFDGDKNFKRLIKAKIGDIDGLYDAGKSYMFAGNLGTGKTYTSCCILKLAIANHYSCLYTTMADVVANILSHSVDTSQYYKDLISRDFLAIDEFSSHWIFPSEKAGQIFGTSLEYVLRTRFQNQLPTLLCSNDSDIDKIFGGFFAKSFKSLRSRHMEVMIVGGRDYRRANA
tara:strand:+ start:37 stop:714 length:678 start_codon:yes stop_codon:yes gene_type:complete